MVGREFSENIKFFAFPIFKVIAYEKLLTKTVS